MCQDAKKTLTEILIHSPWVIKKSKFWGKNYVILLRCPSLTVHGIVHSPCSQLCALVRSDVSWCPVLRRRGECFKTLPTTLKWFLKRQFELLQKWPTLNSETSDSLSQCHLFLSSKCKNTPWAPKQVDHNQVILEMWNAKDGKSEHLSLNPASSTQ